MSEQSRQSIEPPPQEQKENQPGNRKRVVVELNLRLLRYRDVLKMLPFSPKLALLLVGVRGFLLKTLLTVVVIAMVGSCTMTLSRVSGYSEDISQGSQFIVDTVGAVGVRNGKIEWQKDAPVNATMHLKGIRLDILDNPADFNVVDLPYGAERRGILISHDSIRFWTLDGNADDSDSLKDGVVMVNCLQTSQLQYLEGVLNKHGENQFLLSEDNRANFNSLIFVSLFMALASMEFFMAVKMMIFYGAVLGLVMLFLGGRGHFRGMGAVFSVGLNFTLIPTLVAFYFCTAELTKHVEIAYFFCQIGYLIYTVVEGRNGVLTPVANREKKE